MSAKHNLEKSPSLDSLVSPVITPVGQFSRKQAQQGQRHHYRLLTSSKLSYTGYEIGYFLYLKLSRRYIQFINYTVTCLRPQAQRKPVSQLSVVRCVSV